MNIFRLGTSFDTSRLPSGAPFSEVVARITGDDPMHYTVPYYGRATSESPTPIGTVWSVNLTGWQAPAATPPSTNAPRNQLALTSCTAQILLQTDGASETLLVDYPCSGTSFCVAAQSIEVRVIGETPDASLTAPILAAYLAPAAGVTGTSEAGRCATLTSGRHSFSSGGDAVTFDVPVRARGMVPLVHIIAGSPTPSFGIAQFMPGLGTLVDSIWNPPVGGIFLNSVLAMHPLAQTVTVTPNGAPGDLSNLALMWILQTCQ
jgi:hypothetical protein